jgi:bifunctional non-homologous end joining protein LigD
VPDTLKTYRAKRDFSRTKEPRGRPSRTKAPKGLSFVIQKHAARRLHYDLRLELDGALKSWAVTKGPSLVPADKRLAVHVEDHPMDYADFEGTIPEGEYGGGKVIVWDRGTWEPVFDAHKGLAKGHLEFRLDGEKLHGVWHLVRLKPRPGEKRDNWLLIKSDDAFARTPDQPAIVDELPQSVKTGRTVEQVGEDAPEPDPEPEPPKPTPKRKPAPAAAAKAGAEPAAKRARSGRGAAKASGPDPARIPGAKKATMPDFVEPCLASLVEVTPSGAPWVHEVKFDGYRLQARLDRGKVTLRTRNGLDWTSKFRRAPFLKALEALPAQQALIDGELVVDGQGGVSDFGALQDAIARQDTAAMCFYAFDLLYRDGADLTRAALAQRKDALRALLPEDSVSLRYSEHTTEGGAVLLRHACRMGLEGIVSKKADAPYRPGRGRDWV